MKFRRIIFDMDGTLIHHDRSNESEQVARILNLKEELIPEFNKRLNDFFSVGYSKRFYSRQRMSKEKYLNALETVIEPLELFNVTSEQVAYAIDKKAKFFSVVEDDVEETLEYIKDKGYQLCVLTNGFFVSQCEILRYKGLMDYFERVFAWDNYYIKPDLRAFRRAIIKINANEAVMVGDNLNTDIIPAKELGIYTIGFRLKLSTEDKIGPDAQIQTFKELKDIL